MAKAKCSTKKSFKTLQPIKKVLLKQRELPQIETLNLLAFDESEFSSEFRDKHYKLITVENNSRKLKIKS